MTHLDLFEKWLSCKHLTREVACNELILYVLEKNDIPVQVLKPILEKFIKKLELRWKPCHRDRRKFFVKNEDWLKLPIKLHQKEDYNASPRPSVQGRPQKPFQELCKRSQQMRVKDLVSTTSIEKLSFATQVSLRKCGKRSAADIVKDVTQQTSPKRAKSYKRAYSSAQSGDQKVLPLTPEEALSLIITTKSSKSTYLAYRAVAKQCKANIYPAWNTILSAKQACYPDKNAIIVNEVEAEIKLQDLLDLTIRRICELQAEVIEQYSSDKLVLFCKWGIDGSSGQSNCRQLVKNCKDDSSVLICSLVPIQLRDLNDDTKILWQNPVPSSTKFCRPIKFKFCKETPETTLTETENIKNQINDLHDFWYNGKNIKFKLVLSMLDGKICNVLSGTKSTLSCYICKATPNEMNNLQNVNMKTPIIDNLDFGLSSLHTWIRFFECCLHIGYRMEIKCWQARKDNKSKMKERKKLIIDRCRKELGILVDQPKPGYGTTNTGNTARVFFRNAEKAADITGVDKEIIQRFHIILQTISSGYEIDTQKFKKFTTETAEKYVELYSWYYMPTSLHKILIHGADIISHAILPIGQLGEEAQEAKNKDFKFVREHRTRKDSAYHTNEDLLNYLLLSSDPMISQICLKKKHDKNKLKLDPEAINLLKCPSIFNTSTSAEVDSSSDSE